MCTTLEGAPVMVLRVPVYAIFPGLTPWFCSSDLRTCGSGSNVGSRSSIVSTYFCAQVRLSMNMAAALNIPLFYVLEPDIDVEPPLVLESSGSLKQD